MKQTTILKGIGGRMVLPTWIITAFFIGAVLGHLLFDVLNPRALPPLELWQWQLAGISTPIFALVTLGVLYRK